MRPLGFAKIKLLELVFFALKANNNKLNMMIEDSDILASMIELFVIYQWNNVLHQLVEKIFDCLVSNNLDRMLYKVLSNIILF
jgi:hypothetical protein